MEPYYTKTAQRAAPLCRTCYQIAPTEAAWPRRTDLASLLVTHATRRASCSIPVYLLETWDTGDTTVSTFRGAESAAGAKEPTRRDVDTRFFQDM